MIVGLATAQNTGGAREREMIISPSRTGPDHLNPREMYNVAGTQEQGRSKDTRPRRKKIGGNGMEERELGSLMKDSDEREIESCRQMCPPIVQTWGKSK
jgi:hypothetical protein